MRKQTKVLSLCPMPPHKRVWCLPQFRYPVGCLEITIPLLLRIRETTVSKVNLKLV